MDTLTYWERQPTDNPFTLNGFKGTWNFSDHDLVSNELRNFIMESFHPQERFKRIPLEDINKLMNDVWEGPGSMAKIQRLYLEMRNARLSKSQSSTKDLGEVKTMDDYSDEEMTSKEFDLPPEKEEE